MALERETVVSMKQMRLLLIFSVLTLLACQGLAQTSTNITLKGTVVGGAGKDVFLFRYSDALSRMEVEVDQAVVSAGQEFELHAYANYPTLMVLQIENYSQSFFVEPGRTYELYVPRFDWNLNEKKDVWLDPETLPLEFVNLPKDELNVSISSFETVVAEYIEKHRTFFDVRYKPQKRYFDSLAAEVERRVPNTDNEFFNRYKRYKLAELKYAMHFDTRRHMMRQHVLGQPILYYDENYMSLFFALNANSLSKGTTKLPAWRIAGWVNALEVDRFMDSIGVDTLLRNEQVRELVALQALQEAYYNDRYYESDKVLQMIELIGTRTKFTEHRTLVQNMVQSFRKKEKGAEVPSFQLPDAEKRMVNLDGMKGKWVYLSFVRVGEPNSLSEIETLAHFKDSIYAHNDNVEFVTVDCDREFQTMYHFLRNTKKGGKYNWTWLHFNGNYRLLEHYRVVSYPTFILINPEGQLQYDVTPAPATGFLLRAPWQKKAEEDAKPFFLRQ